MAKPGQIEKQWHIVDASDEVLGRLASDIAVVLMGKHRPEYTPHVDCGDFVIVINAEKVAMTGRRCKLVTTLGTPAIQACVWRAMAIASSGSQKT